MRAILVTGATGNVGSEVLRLLRDRGQPVRAALRHPATAGVADDAVESVRFDFGRPETYGAALRDVDKLFLVRPPDLADTRKYFDPFIAAARDAGVGHVVFLSLLGAERIRVVPHRRIERSLEASGMAWTFLRASFFMQNLSTVHRAEIRERGEIFVPAGRGRTSFIDGRDIAAAAAKALTESGHEGRAYPLTGGEALDYYQVARVFTEVLGKRIVYANPSAPRFAARMRGRGHPPGLVLVMMGIYLTARLGLAAMVTGDTATLLGRAPTTMREFAADYKACWM